MTKFYTLFSILILFACSPTEKVETTGNQSPAKKESKPVEKKAEIKPETLTQLPAEMKTLGKEFITGRKWFDANGENLVLFTTTKEIKNDHPSGDPANTHSLYAEHLVKKEGTTDYELVRKVQDFENECILSNDLALIEKSISITDLDNDNHQEISFMYTLGCRSDPSKQPLKLMFLENGDKYAIRGYTRSKYEMTTKYGENAAKYPESIGKNFDPAFDKAPKGFKDFANSLWNEHDVRM